MHSKYRIVFQVIESLILQRISDGSIEQALFVLRKLYYGAFMNVSGNSLRLALNSKQSRTAKTMQIQGNRISFLTKDFLKVILKRSWLNNKFLR